VDDYYPFGMTYHTSERTGYTTNNFLYNGKELTSELDLDWYDYGARMYDASVGRWSVIDPLADAYNSYSPYNYVLNQPTQAIDPDGMSLNYWGDDYHVDTKSQTVTKVETDWADRIFVNGQLQYEGKSDGELDGYVDVDEYYHDYSQFFNEKYGDRLLNDSFFAKQLNLLGDNELKSQLIEARVRQAINTYGVEVVMYILEVYGTVVTIGELSAIIDGLGPVAKTYIKKYLKDRANKKVIQNAAKGDSMIKEGLKLIDDMFQNRRFQKYLKDQGLKSNNYLEQKLDDLLYESQLDELIKNYMKN
jgi:RHS repeat-associated protein